MSRVGRRLSDAQWTRLAKSVEVPCSCRSMWIRLLSAPLLSLMACLAAQRAPTAGDASEPLRTSTPSEEHDMVFRRFAMIGLASAIAGSTSAQIVDFARVTDTVRLTHEVPASPVLTMEARVWLSEGDAPWGAIWREQRNSLEHREFYISGNSVGMYLAAVTDEVAGPIPTGRWVHLVCQQDVGRARIWIDGELKLDVATVKGPMPAVSGSSNSLGAGLQNGVSVWPGARIKIDWIRISTCGRYDGSAISEPDECSLLDVDSCTALLFTFDEPAESPALLNRGTVSGLAEVGVPWIAGATAPILQGTSADADGNGVPDECEAAVCLGDVDDSGSVGSIDLAIVLAAWGAPSPKYPAADVNGDGIVDALDLATVLSSWGACP